MIFQIPHQRYDLWKKQLIEEFINMKNFCSAKDNVKRIRHGDNILKETYLLKDCYSKYTKNS